MKANLFRDGLIRGRERELGGHGTDAEQVEGLFSQDRSPDTWPQMETEMFGSATV